MDADSLLRVLEVLRAARVPAWLAGGWGIDALLGEQTRTHRDADLLHDITAESRALAALAALAGLGYRFGVSTYF